MCNGNEIPQTKAVEKYLLGGNAISSAPLSPTGQHDDDATKTCDATSDNRQAVDYASQHIETLHSRQHNPLRMDCRSGTDTAGNGHFVCFVKGKRSSPQTTASNATEIRPSSIVLIANQTHFPLKEECNFSRKDNMEEVATTSTAASEVTYPWSTVGPHQLFNRINNLVSQLIIDFRSKDEFDCVHVHASHNIPVDSDEATTTAIASALKSRHERTTYIELVALFPTEEANQDLLAKIALLVLADGGSITKGDGSSSASDTTNAQPESSYRCTLVYMTNAQAFFSRYQNCKFFMDGTQFPVRKRVPTDAYASEIVADFLFLGDCTNAADITQHQALGITHIVDASNTRVSKSVAKSNNIEYLEIKIMDSASAAIADHFDTVHTFLETARANNGKVLVHCMAGISRSSSLIISYLVKHHNMTLRDAATLVVTERPVVCPNEGFQAQLIVHEATHRNENTIADPPTFAALIQNVSKMWSQTNAVESAFDKMPIDMWRQQQQQKMAYLQEGDPAGQENLPPNPVSGEEVPTEAAKPPKNFLKRGEGKRATSRSGTRRPRPAASAQPAEKPSLSAYVEKLRTTVADSAEPDVVILVPNSAPNSVDNSMLTDTSMAADDAAALAAAAVAEVAAEAAAANASSTVIEGGVAAIEA